MIGIYIRGERLAPVTKRWRSEERRVTRPRGGVNSFRRCGLYKLSRSADDASSLERERLVRTHAGVHDVMHAEVAAIDDLCEALDQIGDIRCARPDIGNGANPLAGAKTSMCRADERLLSGSENPRAANDVSI